LQQRGQGLLPPAVRRRQAGDPLSRKAVSG
jgi:hypothetical protein